MFVLLHSVFQIGAIEFLILFLQESFLQLNTLFTHDNCFIFVLLFIHIHNLSLDFLKTSQIPKQIINFIVCLACLGIEDH